MAKTKVELQNYQGESLSPITIASNVLYEDGRNAQEVFEEYSNETFTPTIENSSSMFKVGQGDSVDYSDNIVNGAYESMVLKGKSMVNCIQEPSSEDVVLPYEFEEGQYVTINDTKESGALGVKLKGQTLVNLVKTSVYGGVQNGTCVDGDYPYKVIESIVGVGASILTRFQTIYPLSPSTVYYLKLTDVAHTNAFLVREHDNGRNLTTQIHDLENKIIKFTTSELGTSDLFFYQQQLQVGAKVKYSENFIISDDVDSLYNVNDYFTGVQSVKMPVLKTTGKNLYVDKGGKINSDIVLHTGLEVVGNRFIPNSYTQVSPGKTHTLYRKNATLNIGIRFYDINKKYIPSTNSIYSSTNILVFKTPSDCYYIRFIDEGNKLDNTYAVYSGDHSSSFEYEPHKSNILTVNEPIELRGIGDVKDELNLLTGEAVERIGEIVLNEDITGYQDTNYSANGYSAFRITSIANIPNGLRNVICDKVKYYPNINLDWTKQEEFFTSNGNLLFVKILSTKASNFEELRSFLSSSPITIQYKLETPVIKTVDLNVVDQNGSVIPTLKSWNTTTHIYSEIPENSLHPILSHSNPTYPVILKPSTKYSIVANSYSNNHTNSTINFNLGGATASTTVGNRVTTITTPSTLSNELLTMSGRGNKLNNVMVIEGDVVGDEPYFEGICDCKSPILSNVGKNLINIKKAERRGSTKCSLINNGDGSITLVGDGDGSGEGILTTSCYTYLEEGKTYTFSFESDGQYSNTNATDTVEAFLLKDGSASEYIHRMTDFITTFTCGRTGDYYIRFDVNKNNTTHKFWNIQLTEGATVYPYEPYKSNTITFDQKDDKTIVLRSLPNGTCDTLNVETGEYVQRIGEVVLNGSEGRWDVSEDRTNTMRFNCYSLDIPLGINNQILCTDKLPCQTPMGIDREGSVMGGGNTAKVMIFGVNKSRLATLDSEGFKSWLSQNPVTVHYELATPIITKVDVQGFPYAYTNGHVQLSSDSIEQSLTPTVEYSVATNRNGQIRTNQKMVEKHQQHLDQLQAMIISNMVNTQYQQTLTTLNYDLLKKEVGE